MWPHGWKEHEKCKGRAENFLVELKWGEICLENMPAISEKTRSVLRGKHNRGKEQ